MATTGKSWLNTKKFIASSANSSLSAIFINNAKITMQKPHQQANLALSWCGLCLQFMFTKVALCG
jgi:hypothetical protein